MKTPGQVLYESAPRVKPWRELRGLQRVRWEVKASQQKKPRSEGR